MQSQNRYRIASWLEFLSLPLVWTRKIKAFARFNGHGTATSAVPSCSLTQHRKPKEEVLIVRMDCNYEYYSDGYCGTGSTVVDYFRNAEYLCFILWLMIFDIQIKTTLSVNSNEIWVLSTKAVIKSRTKRYKIAMSSSDLVWHKTNIDNPPQLSFNSLFLLAAMCKLNGRVILTNTFPLIKEENEQIL